MFENAEIDMNGTWLYGRSAICNLRIIKWNVLYGCGNYEDPPEIREDKEIDWDRMNKDLDKNYRGDKHEY